MTEQAAPTPRPAAGGWDAPATGPATAPPGGAAPPTAGPIPAPPSGSAGFTSRYGLVRPREGRYLAGVCAAVGRATNTDPVLWRVILAVLGFFGGIGILVYVAAWLIIPGEGDSASPVESMLGRGRSSMSPVTVIVLTILVAVSFGYIVTDPFRAVLLGAAILIGGALLLNRDGHAPRPTPIPDGVSPPAPATAPPGPVPPVSYPAPELFTPPPAPAMPVPPGPATGVTPQERTAELPAWSPATPYPPAPADAGSGFPGLPSAPVPPAPAVAAPLPPGYRQPFAPHGPYAGSPTPPPPVRPPKPPKRPRERSALGAVTFSLIFLTLGVVAILDLLGVFPIGAAAYFAAALATIGLGLLVGTWFGRARWLIALGLVTAAALGVATVAESYDRIRGVDGNVTWAPTDRRDLADRYENSFGDATLDLRGVDLDGQDVQIALVVNFGQATVVVPPNVDVTTITDVNAGEATVFGRRSPGNGRSRELVDLGPDGAGGGRLRLYVHVNAGNLEVTR
ncbi:PspC domain-containing protein [Micromonospora sp. KC723]|uniref:PspC domain-containing protein n=1 Tax=Micromonospora sp. KC723 TaxID=2530381 RepID=UPI001049CA39|nr:PspC domain-containing protein [Micromonospora sp. KC723]TDB76548.1 PspC domain-containing protein [Micromonospora sp. KC723]